MDILSERMREPLSIMVTACCLFFGQQFSRAKNTPFKTLHVGKVSVREKPCTETGQKPVHNLVGSGFIEGMPGAVRR